jgi:glycosyltransferase involved in cell wall biosynthesis
VCAKEHLTFTVFTATFNRAHTLHRVYNSLRAQTFLDFEWLIVDDGSVDGTLEQVARWRAEEAMAIRCLSQPHSGKHVAWNRAVGAARGELFLPLDSDDACPPDALARLKAHWDALTREERASFSCVAGLCVDQHGQIVGDLYPRSPLDADHLRLFYELKVRGEKWGFQRTDVLREFPFPELPGAEYITERVIWDRIAEHYKTRYVNEVFRIYYVNEDNPSVGAAERAGRHAVGGHYAARQQLNEQLHWFWKSPTALLRSAARYCRYARHLGVGLGEARRELRPSAWPLCVVAFPIGWHYHRLDRRR